MYNAIQNPVVRAIADGDASRMSSIFEGVALDERILAVGLCDEGGRLLYPTKLMPATFTCDKVARSEAESFATIVNDGRRIMVGALPIVERNQKAYPVILTDLSFIDARSEEAQAFVVVALAGVATAVAGVAAIFVIVLLRMGSLRRAIEEVRSGALPSTAPGNKSSIDGQIKKLLSEIELGRETIRSEQIECSPAALQKLLHKLLPGANNVFETIDRFVESRIDREHASVASGGHETMVRAYPISIEWPPKALVGQPPIDEGRRQVRRSLGLAADTRLAVGIERFDYTKGILDRMRAVDDLLTRVPVWRRRFTFVQVAASSGAQRLSMGRENADRRGGKPAAPADTRRQRSESREMMAARNLASAGVLIDSALQVEDGRKQKRFFERGSDVL